MLSRYSPVTGDPVKRNTITNEKPPLVPMFKVRVPPSRYCNEARLKLTCPLPYGPPVGLYVGRIPTPARRRVDTDATEGWGVRAMNLAQAVVEYGDMKFPPA